MKSSFPRPRPLSSWCMFVALGRPRHRRRRCRRGSRCCAIIRCRRISASSWKRSVPRSASIFSRAKRTARRFPATSAPSSISAPSRRSTSGRSARRYDVYASGYEWLRPFDRARAGAKEPFRVSSAGRNARKPYSASVFNISAMSFGALSANAIRALNSGAKQGRFRPRHRRGRLQPLSPRERRRHHLGDRLGLFRLPQRRRHVQPREIRSRAPAATRSRWSSSS